jgi:hypothetical protein
MKVAKSKLIETIERRDDIQAHLTSLFGIEDVEAYTEWIFNNLLRLKFKNEEAFDGDYEALIEDMYSLYVYDELTFEFGKEFTI